MASMMYKKTRYQKMLAGSHNNNKVITERQTVRKYVLEKIRCPDDRQVLTVHSSLGILHRDPSQMFH